MGEDADEEICQTLKKHDVMLATLIFADGQTKIFRWNGYDDQE